MQHNCVLCDFQHECADRTLFLYASTSTLRQIIEFHLREMGAQFRLKSELFFIESDHIPVVRGLQQRLTEAERADVRVSRQGGAALLSASTLDNFGRNLDTQWFDEALMGDRFTTFFQPIVDASKSTVFAYECLIRLVADRFYSGVEIIAAAFSRGAIHSFDSYARRTSIRQAGAQYVPGTKIFVNFMPSSIYDPAFCMASTLEEMAKTKLEPCDVVFEVVESDKITDVKHLQKICDFYRKSGFGFALDDVGTGSNSLQMVCDLKPDYIKLDKSLISNIWQPMYRTAVQKLTEFAEQFQVRVIAEGVEEAETAEILLGMNIHLMQGFYFGKPAAQMNSIQTHSMATSLLQIGKQLGGSLSTEKSNTPEHVSDC
jgi:EAL domain-containing protein (putative c-di-GMP-specific phosphodiesterase class I)